ncbi:MAG: exodeoxyribonuclease V subunit alpha [Deltaproteobacteria bacterium]|nr:exodeoxyribonuclease V subunit alpha [Deltaproteobacteria bacterium]
MYNDPALAKSELFTNIDTRFAGFMAAVSREKDAAVPLAAALVSRSLRNGHVCLDLEAYAETTLKAESVDIGVIRCPPLQQWRRLLLKSGLTGRSGEYKPLVLDDNNRLYFHRYWEYEQQLADFILERASRTLSSPAIGGQPAEAVGTSLQRLFPENDAGETNWQKVAAAVSMLKQLCVISGGPGTGKTHAVARILAFLLEQYRNAGRELTIRITAPTGKAASRLSASIASAKRAIACEASIKAAIPDNGMTIHRLLQASGNAGRFHYHAGNRLAADVVVVDEASMVDLPLMTKLVRSLPDDSRLLLLGDRDQLASVEAGAVMGDICGESRSNGFSVEFRERVKTIAGMDLPADGPLPPPGLQDCRIHFSKNYRFDEKSGIPRLSHAVNRGDCEEVASSIAEKIYADVHWQPLDRNEKWIRYMEQEVVRHYGRLSAMRHPAEALAGLDRFKILCAINHGRYGVEAVNGRAEAVLERLHPIAYRRGRASANWYHGQPVMIRKNDHRLELYNGDLGIVMQDPASNSGLSVYFAGGESGIRRFAPHRIPEHETAYAMTIHKSQGSEFDEVLLLLPEKDSPVLTRELIYTGITRARQNLSILCSQSAISLAVSRRIERRSGLGDKIAIGERAVFYNE